MIRSVVLCSLNSRYSHTNLALRSLRQYARAQGQSVPMTLIEETLQAPLIPLVHRIAAARPDLVAFSCYLWNIEKVRRLTQDLRQVLPKLIIVWGGPEVGPQAAAWLKSEPAVDYIASGEGETTFFFLLQALQSVTDSQNPPPSVLEGIPGLIYRDRNMQKAACLSPQLLAADAWPFPYRDEELSDPAGRMFYYEASRGCPFSCSYCLSSRDNGVRQRPLDLVFCELERFIAAKVRRVKLVDRTFNSDPARALAIWQFLLKRYQSQPFATNFHFEIAGDRLDDAAIDCLNTAPPGLFQLEIGVQTVQPQVLAAIGRRQDFGHLARQVARLIRKNSVHVHLDLIAGLPGETFQQFTDSFDQVFALKAPHLQLGFLKVLPGTPMQGQAKERQYAYQSGPPYEVLASDALSLAELGRLKKISEVLESYYNSGLMAPALLYLAARRGSAFALFSDFATFLEASGGLARSLSPADRAANLWNFALASDSELEQNEACREAFRSLMRYAYICAGQKDQPRFLHFWEAQEAARERAKILRQRDRFAKLRPEIGRYRIDRLGFDLSVWQKRQKLVSDDLFVVYDLSVRPPRLLRAEDGSLIL